MKRHIIICVLAIASLTAVLTAKADDDITAKNDDGTWTFVKPAGVDLRMKVVYFTKEELDSIAAPAVNHTADSLVDVNKDIADIDDDDTIDDDDDDSATVDKKTSKIKKKSSKRKKSKSRSRRRRSRR
jgi:hypothetical protein